MSKAWRYLAAGVVAYVLVLIATFPAQKASQLIERQVDALVLRSVSGTLFSGQAQQLVYQGLDLGPVSWRFRPQDLLAGRLGYRLELAHEANAGQADIGLTPGGTIHVSTMDLDILPDRLINHFSPVLIGTRGVIRLGIDVLEFEDQIPRRVQGQAGWDDAAVLEPVELTLGQLTLKLENDAGDLLGTIINAEDAGISGTLRLGTTGRYGVNVLIRPGADVRAETLEMLKNVAQRQPDGDFLLRSDGEL